jgi:hypothetical protein
MSTFALGARVETYDPDVRAVRSAIVIGRDVTGRHLVRFDDGEREWIIGTCLTAIAAAARKGGDVQQAPGEAPQSGGIAASPKL